MPESIAAPVKEGQEIGKVRLLLEGKTVAELPAVAAREVRLPGILEGFTSLLENWKIR